jgi:hypothetical protein
MSTITNQSIKTLADVMNFMSPFAGGSVPATTDQEYTDWIRWIVNKQEEYARRGFWRRLLKRDTTEIDSSGVTVLPDDFNRSNGLYIFEVDGVDWAEENNEAQQTIFVEMITDSTSEDFGKWQVVVSNPPTTTKAVTIWYFINPPAPTASTDIILLPGDMIAYGALAEYFRTTGAEGSQDKAEEDAENRFSTYMSMEMIPPKYELLRFTTRGTKRVDYIENAKSRYHRPYRNTQR